MSIPKSTPPSMTIHNQLAAEGNERVQIGRRVMRRIQRPIIRRYITVVKPEKPKIGELDGWSWFPKW